MMIAWSSYLRLSGSVSVSDEMVTGMEITRNQQQQQQQQLLTPRVTVGQHGSVGGAIGVVVVIAVMGIVAVLVGRLCSGRKLMGYGPHMDAESWVESKCSTCVDGNVTPPPYPRAIDLQRPMPHPLPIPIPIPLRMELRTEQDQQQQQQQQQNMEDMERSEPPQHQPQHHHQQSGHSHAGGS